MSDPSSHPTLESIGLEPLAERFQDYSHRILNCAYHSASSATFILDVSKMLLESCGCDAIELEVPEDGKAQLGCCWRQADQSIRVEALMLAPPPAPDCGEEAGDDPDLRTTCREAVEGGLEQRPPFLTEHGSYWVGTDTESSGAAPLSVAIESHAPELLNIADYPSLALIPFIVEGGRTGSLLLLSRRRGYIDAGLVRLHEWLAITVGMAVVFRRSQLALRERVKELTCLYRLAQLSDECETLDRLLHEVTEILPEAWLYPEVAVAEVALDGLCYRSGGNEQVWREQMAPIVVRGEERGSLMVGYVQQRPILDEGPFLEEERILIDTVAREVAQIVETKQAEAEQLQLQKQLRHADRLSTIGQLSAGVAHELNEPLGSILGFAQLLRKNPDLSDVARRDVEKIEAASLHAREVIKKLMIFSRQVQPTKVDLDLNSVIEESLYLLEARCAKEGIEVARSLPDSLPRIHGDLAQIRQVMVNLIVNAIQAMSSGGRLSVSTSFQDGDVILIVEDTGIGMNEEVRKQVFLPFFSTKDVGQGTGLGLSVVHGIVTSHRGTIKVESEPDHGSRFEIRFPQCAHEDGAERAEDGVDG
jgi:signal transduction histidine kinase